MKDELKAKWLEALRGGKFLQGKGAFLKNGAYCCLGVLCEVAGAPLVEHTEEPDEGEPQFSYFVPESLATLKEGENGAVLFESEALAELGLGKEVQDKLFKMNDGCGEDETARSFPEIADWIERHNLESGEEIKG